jgi:hypothetical protein
VNEKAGWGIWEMKLEQNNAMGMCVAQIIDEGIL